jgi:hypothetical protein
MITQNPTTVQSGGTGYTAGDVLTIVGGTPVSVAATYTVATVSGGVITSVNPTNFAQYSVLPANPVSVTGGTGSSATLNLTYGVGTSAFTITNAGSGYVEQPTVTFSGGGGSGAAAYAIVGGGVVIRSIGVNTAVVTNQAITFETAGSSSSRPAFVIRDISTGDSWYQMGGGSTNTFLIAKGNTNANAYLGASGGGSVRFTTSGDSINEQMRVSHTASAVNYVQVTGGSTGNAPYFISQGSDTNVNLWYGTKGTGYHAFFTAGNGANVQFLIANTASAVNYVQTSGSTTGFGAKIFSAGSDTNIPLVLQPKGTGALQAQQTDSTATGGNARGARAVDWQTSRSSASQVASGSFSVVGGGSGNSATTTYSAALSGLANTSSGVANVTAGGLVNVGSGIFSAIVGGGYNTSGGWYNFIGGGFTNSGTANAAVTTQSGTMNGTTAVTLSGSNASIKVGQIISGTSIADDTYVAAISGTSLTLSKVASGSSTSTLSFFTPHGVVVGGGNNQATGSYSFIGGGGDAGSSSNRNVASGDWSVVVGGRKNTASGQSAFVGAGGDIITSVFANTASGVTSAVVCGFNNIASGYGSFVGGGSSNVASATYSALLGGNSNSTNSDYSSIVGGAQGTTRSIIGNNAQPYCNNPLSSPQGASQAASLVLARQTTDATATVLTSNTSAASGTNQIILPNNSAYYFKGSVIANVTGGGNTKGWSIEGVIKRGANAASTALVGTPTVTSAYADAGASTWAITATADTTNGGLAITFTGQASTTIRVVAKLETTEVTF